MLRKFQLILIFLICGPCSFSQVKETNEFLKWSTWVLMQAIPSVNYYEDRDNDNTRIKFGMQWQVIPFSYSFSTNKYVSPVSSFFIRPVKRFSGSAEIFFQPEFIPGGFKYAELKKFMFKTGVRTVIPVFHRGEYLAFSLGTGYYRQKDNQNNIIDGITYEAVVYSFFGMLGLKVNYNQNAASRYNFGLYFKYY